MAKWGRRKRILKPENQPNKENRGEATVRGQQCIDNNSMNLNESDDDLPISDLSEESLSPFPLLL